MDTSLQFTIVLTILNFLWSAVATDDQEMHLLNATESTLYQNTTMATSNASFYEVLTNETIGFQTEMINNILAKENNTLKTMNSELNTETIKLTSKGYATPREPTSINNHTGESLINIIRSATQKSQTTNGSFLREIMDTISYYLSGSNRTVSELDNAALSSNPMPNESNVTIAETSTSDMKGKSTILSNINTENSIPFMSSSGTTISSSDNIINSSLDAVFGNSSGASSSSRAAVGSSVASPANTEIANSSGTSSSTFSNSSEINSSRANFSNPITKSSTETIIVNSSNIAIDQSEMRSEQTNRADEPKEINFEISSTEQNSINTVGKTATELGVSKTNNDNSSAKASETSGSKYIVLVLQKDCQEKSDFPNMFSMLDTHMSGLLTNGRSKNVNINQISCDTFVHLKFSVDSAPNATIQEAVEVLLMNFTLGENFKVLKVFPTAEDYNQIALFSPELTKSKPCDDCENIIYWKEMIAYITAASSLCLLLVIIILLSCARLICRKQKHSLDLCEVPHINLRLEDYKLTPIPRPTISFPDYTRDIFNVTYSGHPSTQSEDIAKHSFLGERKDHCTIQQRKENSNIHQEMKSFAGRPCTRVQSLYCKPNSGRVAANEWINSSISKSNEDHNRKAPGVDNFGFKKWF